MKLHLTFTCQRTLLRQLLLLGFVSALGWGASRGGCKAQDIHFSQIDVNPILLNPAYSGFFNGAGRVGLVYRNQWANVGDAFQTMALSGEVSLLRRRRQRDGLSLGIWAYRDRAGELRYGTTAATAALSYFLSLDRNGGFFLSGAVELGYGQSGFDPTDASLYDPEESFGNTTSSYPLVGAGLAVFVQPNDDFYLKLGVSGRNLNRPNISYQGHQDVFLERKVNIYGRAEYRAWNSVSLMPVVLWQLQRQYRELVAGCDAKWYISEGGGDMVSASAGIRYRALDAVYLEYTFEYNAFLFCFNYDANLSRLTPASHTVGAFELGMVYRITPNQHVKRKAVPCPII